MWIDLIRVFELVGKLAFAIFLVFALSFLLVFCSYLLTRLVD